MSNPRGGRPAAGGRGASFADRGFLPESLCRGRWLYAEPAWECGARDRLRQKARLLRRLGLKWREVGERLGISTGHASALAREADQEDCNRLGFPIETMDLWSGIRAMAAVERLVELTRRG